MHLNFTLTLSVKYHDYPHFADEETDANRLSDVVETTHLVGGPIKIRQSRIYHLCCRGSSSSGKSVHLLEISHPEHRLAGIMDIYPAEGVGRKGTADLVLGHVDWSDLTEGQTPVSVAPKL